MSVRRIRAVGAVIVDSQGRLLLIQRGQAPSRGNWSLPGGRVQDDETDEAAVAREVHEETGLLVTVESEVGAAVIEADNNVRYAVHDFRCRVVGGTLRAGDDAEAAGWFTAAEMSSLPTTPGLLDYLRQWGVVQE